MKRLNLGCGNEILPGFLNVDIIGNKGVDKVVNLDQIPYPFKDNEFQVIICNYVLEHLRPFPEEVIRELHRILEPGGRLVIKVPHYTNPASYTSQHKHYFGACSMKGFVKGNPENDWFDFSFNRLEITFRFCRGLLSLFTVPIEWLANNDPAFFEETPLKLFHAEDIIFTLIR